MERGVRACLKSKLSYMNTFPNPKMYSPKETAHKYFGVILPVERAALKSKFRQAAKALHTDTSGGDTAALFIAMKAAYDDLCKLPGTFTDGPELQATEEGTSLSDLGNGLGAMKNGKDCTECGGKGYRTETGKHIHWSPRPPCDFCQRFNSTFGCRKCDGAYTKKWVLSTRHKICAPCQGKGEIEIYNPVIPKGLLAGLRLKK